ncbi:helix-turn-helix domain-containing protein [Flammeovirga aprica]|uniref:Helix-turn-helix domain-containing protein n=1 Tax=Flammeovirga aprica JL-4 TaxID=694437 RepID=A0A7X9P1H6_9BACT|nr:helix-turn-helix domain-containing protein [Flammeovirga aprica]NME67824.1 helix-turn-helix domain-containing protein [Flammeovirga aprica JL-4]
MYNSNFKVKKLLIGLCLNEGRTIEEVAQHLGLSSNQDEIREIVDILEEEGFIQNTCLGYKNTTTELTVKGSKEASTLIEVVH